MSIRSNAELNKLRAVGRVVRDALRAMAGAARPGVTTRELDQIGQRVLRENGAESAPASVYGFPGSNCISVNEEAIHGVPGDRTLREGDLLKLDVTAVKDGFVADAALTHRVGRVPPQADALARCAESAFRQGARAATAGTRVNEVGRAVEKEVRRRGFRVIRELCGHGVGRAIHEDPLVPNYYEPRLRARLTEGLVITIEPIIAAGLGTGRLQPNGWTIRTADGSLSAHYEHTVVITRAEPILITA